LKYAPLIWSALWRKPTEAVLTWLTVTAAFALFGLMLGVNTTLQSYIEAAPEDVLSIYKRFPLVRLPIGMRDRIAGVDGVSEVVTIYGLEGYHADRRNPVYIITVDEGATRAAPQFQLKPEQWARLFARADGLIVSEKAAVKWNLKVGDTFVVSTRPGRRADGGTGWPFQVVEVAPDVPDSTGFLIGNYRYIDEARPAQEQGRDVMFQALIADGDRAPEISRTIDRLFGNSGTPTLSISQRLASQNMQNSNGHRTLATTLVGAAGLFMILLLVANGIAQSVRERSGEFAVLRALGFQNGKLVGLVFGEAAIPCLAGAVAGTLLAHQLTRLPGKLLPADFASLPVPTVSVGVMLWALAFGVLLAIASSVVPLMKVARMSVTSQLGGLAR
jgi:putative ABC transport system permease protein